MNTTEEVPLPYSPNNGKNPLVITLTERNQRAIFHRKTARPKQPYLSLS